MSGVFVARESRTRKAKSLTHIVFTRFARCYAICAKPAGIKVIFPF